MVRYNSFVVAFIICALFLSGCSESKSTPTSPTSGVNNPPGVELVVVTTTELPPAVRGEQYSSKVEAVGGKAPLTFSADGLPTGLAMSSNGMISGVPAVAGTFEVAVSTKDAINETGGKVLPLSVSAPKVVVFGTPAEVATNGGFGISVEVLRLHPAVGATITPLLDTKAGTEGYNYMLNNCRFGVDPRNRCYGYALRFVNTTGKSAKATLGFTSGASGPIIMGRHNVGTDIAATGVTIITYPDDGSLTPIYLGGVNHFVAELDEKKRVSFDMGWATGKL